MTEFNVCFVGIGSIAKRHIKNLRTIFQRSNIQLNVDAVRRMQSAAFDQKDLGLRVIYTDYSQIDTFYDAIFITNPTEYHIDALKATAKFSKHFFIEKPISSVSQIDTIDLSKLDPDAVYYVACPLRYCAVIQYIKNNLVLEDVVSVRSISSSYLPDWRPGTDYRKTYSAQKALGGGVSIDLIHEWDYLSFFFGMPQQVKCLVGKKSDLEIDSDDFAIYVAEYPDKILELHLDYFGRKTIREIMLFTKTDTILGDIENGQITFLKSGKTIHFDEERDDYQIMELEHFLSMFQNPERNDSNIKHAVQVLRLTQGKV